ncbi:MAG: Hsp20/alpha crystallin family protein [Lactobacillales bacterium]|nr:Hsp20/alpha crystallin family protein [Lactobacillales bacterium]
MSKNEITFKNKAYTKDFSKAETVQDEINRIFDRHLGYLSIPAEDQFNLVEPRIEIIDTPGAVEVTAELPGMDAKDIEINVSTDGYLTIKGEKRSKIEEKKGGSYFTERSYGMISRTLPLPADINHDKVTAEFEKGVLKIEIPKLESAKTKVKKIAVKNK